MRCREMELAKEIRAQLERDTRVDLHAHPITVRVAEASVQLDGTVANIAAKRVARRRTHEAARGLPVLDRLLVAVPDADSRAQLRTEVVHLLEDEPEFNTCGLRVRDSGSVQVLRANRSEWGNYHIEIEVPSPGIVDLSGNVLSLSHRRLAEVLAWWAAGCRRVDNLLHVVPPEQETDGELADAVRLVLEKDPLVSTDQISIHADQGTVTLAGWMRSDEERRLAVFDVWYIPGVQDVVDEIQIVS